jgi:hypothetical protein
MATQTGSPGSRQGREGRAEESRTSTRPNAGITQEQQNTASLGSPASRAGSSGAGASGNGGLAGFVREAASNRLTQQKDRATRGLGDVARAVRNTTNQLRADGQETVAGYIERAADGIDRLTHTLETRDVQEVVDGIQSFARRQPVIFIGAALGLGFVGARFLKSSGRQRAFGGRDLEERRYGQSGDWRAVTAPPVSTATPASAVNRPIGDTRR